MCGLNTLPQLDTLINLRELNVTNNRLKSLPSFDAIAGRRKRKIDLSDNKLKQVPERLPGATRERRLDRNEFPKWLNYEILVK